jgi:hypothetical protein
MAEREKASLERALALDPNFITPAAQLTGRDVEHGNLIKGYQDAKALVVRHPENAMAHFALSYVLRYGGAVDESAHECDTALALDPGNFTFRSCAFTFEQLGNYPRAMEFLQLDAGSEWSSSNMVRLYLRDGKLAAARELAMKFQDSRWGPMISACIDNLSSENTAKLTREAAAGILADPDPETHYVVAADVLFCGQKDLALHMIKTSIDGHYCAYTGLQNDSIWAKLRGTPEWAEFLAEAKKCQDDFIAERDK